MARTMVEEDNEDSHRHSNARPGGKVRKWINEAPPTDSAVFSSPLPLSDRQLVFGMVDRFRPDVRVVLAAMTSTLGLSHVVNFTPEIGLLYESLCHHQTKVAVIVENGVEYETPYREGTLRVREAGCQTNLAKPAHIVFVGSEEINDFLLFGSATLLIVFKSGGAISNMEKEMTAMARMVAKGRLESILIVIDEHTPQEAWQLANCIFGRHGITVRYNEITS